MPARQPAGLPWPALLALSAAAFTDVLTDLLPAGLLPQMSASLHVPPARIGLLVTGFAVAASLAAIPVTAALRGLPRRGLLIGLLAGFAAGNAVTASSSLYLLTFAARLLAGLMGGTLWSMLAGYAVRIVPAAQRGRATAVVLAGLTVALCLGLPAGTALAGALGWRSSFAALAALAGLLMAWVRWQVPPAAGQARVRRVPVRRVLTQPGIPAVLAVTLLLVLGHQAMYTYIAPFAAQAGLGRISLVLFVFGIATIAGIWIAGQRGDRHLRPTLLGALALIASAMSVLGLDARVPALTLALVALWGVAFGAAPTLLQIALVSASGPVSADVATALQTTVYNAGIAAGALSGGLILAGLGPAGLPWATALCCGAALALVSLARRTGFPPANRAERAGGGPCRPKPGRARVRPPEQPPHRSG